MKSCMVSSLCVSLKTQSQSTYNQFCLIGIHEFYYRYLLILNTNKTINKLVNNSILKIECYLFMKILF